MLASNRLHLSLRRRMLLLNLLGVSLTLLLMLAVFSALNARASMQRQSNAMLELAQVMAVHAAPMLEARDQHAADILLSSLSTSSHVSQGAIFDGRGATFASWTTNGQINVIGYPDLQSNHPFVGTDGSTLVVDVPILVAGSRAGALRLRGSEYTIATSSREFMLIGLVFTVGAIALLVLILHRYQLRMLASTVEVSEIASRIVAEHDQHLRSKLDRGDELGHLTERFNRLLKQLDEQSGKRSPAIAPPRTSVFDRLVNYDRLTRLPGRHFFKSALDAVVQGARERHELAALMLIGLDDISVSCAFTNAKAENGVLRRCARRMALTLRSSDLFCHIGGGQFAVILPAVHRLQQVQLLAERLMEAAAANEDGEKLRVSIGIACCPNDADDPISLMRQADMAMYAARHSGTSAYRFFDKVIGANSIGRRGASEIASSGT